MASYLRVIPNFARRRALQGHWEQHTTTLSDGNVLDYYGYCRGGCHSSQLLNILEICQACNFKDKMSSLTIIAEPWGLREVRKQFGHGGETNRLSEYNKEKKHEADTELVANSVSLDTYQKRVAKQYE